MEAASNHRTPLQGQQHTTNIRIGSHAQRKQHTTNIRIGSHEQRSSPDCNSLREKIMHLSSQVKKVNNDPDLANTLHNSLFKEIKDLNMDATNEKELINLLNSSINTVKTSIIAVKTFPKEPPSLRLKPIKGVIEKKAFAITNFFKTFSASQTRIQISDRTEVQVRDAHSTKSMNISMPTNFSERPVSNREMKAQGGYSKRTADDTQTAKNYMRTAYEERQHQVPDSSRLVSSVTFEKLKGARVVDYQQLTDGANNKLLDIANEKKMFFAVAQEGASFISRELNQLLQTLPNAEIKTLADLKSALKESVQTHNARAEIVDKKTFRDLVGHEQKIPRDLNNAPEFKDALKAYKDSLNPLTVNEKSWKKGETKNITFTHLSADNLKEFDGVIDDFFRDESTISVLKNFGIDK
jgi:hypothetical protein